MTRPSFGYLVAGVPGATQDPIGHLLRARHRRHRPGGAPVVVARLAEDRRIHGLRQDRHHVDALIAGELLPEALREGPYGELARHVGADLGGCEPAPHRRHVDENALALLPELGERRVGAVDLAEEVGLDDPPVDLGRDLLEATVHHYTGVVDPGIYPPEDLDAAAGELPHGLLVCHVGRDGERPPPRPRQRPPAGSPRSWRPAPRGRRALRRAWPPPGRCRSRRR